MRGGEPVAHQVPWCRKYLDIFCEEACLSELERKIMETRVQGWSQTRQCAEYGLSPATLSRIIARLKKKYDVAQQNNPELPPRRFSAKETWMDTH